MRKILVSAYACEPHKGSEQAVGWNLVLQLAGNNEVHVITRANNRECIEEYIRTEKIPHLFFHYYDTPNLFLKLKHKEKGVYLYYILWQIGILGLIRKLVKEQRFDYTFHCTFGSIWLPSFFFLFRPRFIWGPLGGGESIPDSFIPSLSMKGRILQYARKILKFTVYINPAIIFSAIKAEAILCRTEDTIATLPKVFRKKCSILTDGAIENGIFSYKCSHGKKEKIKLIATSRLVHTKNISTVIKAIRLIPKEYSFKLILVGSGPEEKRIDGLIQEYGLVSKIQKLPFIPREDVFKLLSVSDIYVFASLKEACNLSLLEAMAVGLPVVCLDWSGMAVSTDPSCAIRLPVSTPEQMPEDMAEAMVRLIRDPELRRQMGDAGRKRIKEKFTWEAKGEFLENLMKKLDDGYKR